MLIVPSSRIILLKNPIEIDYSNELTFSSKEAQYNYFYNLPKLECENATYQRKDEVVRFPTDPTLEGTTYDDLIEYNYCMYQNDKWSNKWFYAFVKKVTFDNPGMSYIELETDVWQSWCFDITFKNSFIEREHVNDDTLGLHTIPEGLETGEYIVNFHESETYNTNLTAIMGTTIDPNDKVYYGGATYTGIPSALRYYRYDNIGSGLNPESNTLMYAIKQLQKGHADSINTIFLAPKWLCGGNTENIPVAPSNNVPYQNIFIQRMTALDTYVPVNKKLLCFPYCYILVSNAQGQANTYRQEVWDDTQFGMNLRMQGCLTPSCSIRIFPIEYNGCTLNYDEGLTLGKFPQLNWYTDQYTNWQTLNGISLGAIKLNAEESGYLGGAINTILGVASLSTGNPHGFENIGSGIGSVLSTMQETYRHSLIPPTINGSLNAGDVISATGINCFHFYKMSIKEEYARIIDSYFSMYGYKVNDVKLPNITGRINWNYVKTIGCNIIGNIPQEDMQKIKNIFDKGITFWHNPNTFLDYSQNNSII